ncbi:MAG TPA: contractile injection system tape measure protein [Hanamia sp.]
MIQQKHTIKKFSLELQTQSSLQSHTLQRKCVKLVKEELINDIDKLLSDYFPEDELVRINTIEIDLGNMTNENFEKDFVAKCMAELTHKIKGIPLKQKLTEGGETIKVVEEENSLQQFFYFLSTGKMPWTAFGINFMEWQTAIGAAVQLNPDSFIKKFGDFLQKNPQATERLLMQFDDEFINRILELFLPGIKDEIDIQEMMKWIAVLHSKGADEKIFLQIKNAIVAAAKKTNDVIDVKTLTETTVKKPRPENIIKEVKKETEEEMDKLKAENKSIYINNAGLIILHPFLQNLFTATGLLQLKNFKDNFCKQKAVHLLQYLVNGQQQQPEYMMLLNKILCGLSDEEHMDRFIKIEETEIKEANELLQAVITHWAVLKNTSPQGLQETFLQRNGKLSFNETDRYWKLQVERKSVDILLDKLPWGFSYVQLPWMKFALITEW